MNAWMRGSLIAALLLAVLIAVALLRDFSFLPAEKVEAEQSALAAVASGADLPEELQGEWYLDYEASLEGARGTPLGVPDVEASRETVVTLGARLWMLSSEIGEEAFEISVLETPEPGVWYLGAFVQQKLLVIEVVLKDDGRLVVDSPLNQKLKHFVWRR